MLFPETKNLKPTKRRTANQIKMGTNRAFAHLHSVQHLKITVLQNKIVKDDIRLCCSQDDFSRQLEPTEGNSKDKGENNHKSCPVCTVPSEELSHKSICPHISPSSCVTLRLNPHFASCFVKELNISPRYRSSVFSTAWFVKLQNPSPTLVIKLRSPKSEYLDRNWCGKVQRLLYERLELEHLFSWLSTLGGAYSSLGDNFTPCAELAGKISLQQMKIGLRLGDPHIVARCYLYLALSFIQKLRLRKAAAVIRWVYSFAKASALEDKRLCNMCLGMWARLQYTWSQERCTRVDKRG